MNSGVFVTGTDTDCGKTFVAQQMLWALRDRGVSAVGFKPVAAGAVEYDGKLRNDDALALAAASSLAVSYEAINPYCLEAPVSPHIAAADAGVLIELDAVVEAFGRLAKDCDVLVAEGAGGWRVPLAPTLDIQDLAIALGLPVVLVVGLRLGCLNHARLTEQAIIASGVRLLGWVATQVDPAMSHVAHNLETLNARLATPCLGWFPHRQAGVSVPPARPLDLATLFGVGK